MGQDGMAFAAETGSGHLVNMDGAPEGGGRNLAPRPMEMVLLGTGGCTAYDVVMILKKSRQEIEGCSVTLKADRASEDPKVFTKIHFHFTVTGKNLNPATVERAINLSHDKYCSASIMLAKTAELTHSFDIVSKSEHEASAKTTRADVARRRLFSFERRQSGPISRILCTRRLDTGARGNHSSRRAIADVLKLPTRRRTGAPSCIARMRACLFGIAPGGGCRAGTSRDVRGALLPHRFTLT
ncbi:OsmC/Ohr family protein [Candidatus Paraburkholderia kirkii UZHbot1]|uniref:OsmC/Ohr family protein n=1 Tax=Candidatus Paraburkholderia kirkii UZHbot1 TaxID=1055526 RepID=G4MCH0_9BURK|nr:OsmC/Ohr family protein [Candidatus Paraburkholderia kirkii UZHbot1]